MLPRTRRVTSAADHKVVGRRGRRAGGDHVVVNLLSGGLDREGSVPGLAPARAGLAVGRTVGNSVVRHRVSRRLRHLLAARLPEMPAGTAVIVRALPSAATASSVVLGVDLDRALARARRPSPRPGGGYSTRPAGGSAVRR